MRKEYEKLLADFLLEGDEDDIGLWEITGALSRIIGVNDFKLSASDSEKLLQTIAEFVPILLQNGFVATNFEQGKGYIVWPDQNPAVVTQKIEDEWLRLKGMKPDINFIAYFRKTDPQPVKRPR